MLVREGFSPCGPAITGAPFPSERGGPGSGEDRRAGRRAPGSRREVVAGYALEAHNDRMRSPVAVAVLCGVYLVGCSSADSPDDGGSDPPPAASTSSAPSAAAWMDDVAHALEERLDVFEGTYPAALALVRVGDETRFVSAGPAERGSSGEVSDRHRFQIGSVSKPMLAVAVMQLVEEETVKLGDTVDELLPGLVPGGDEITVEQLLSHRSGLFNYTESDRFQVDGRMEAERVGASGDR